MDSKKKKDLINKIIIQPLNIVNYILIWLFGIIALILATPLLAIVFGLIVSAMFLQSLRDSLVIKIEKYFDIQEDEEPKYKED